MAFLDGSRFRAAYLPFVFFVLFAGDAVRYTISWYGFGVIAIGLTTIAVIMLVRARRRGAWTWASLPFFLCVFLALATVSITWSFYPGATALGLLVTWMAATIGASVAVSFSWAHILRAMGIAFRIILGLSLVFEFVVSAFIRHPILPLWVDYGTTTGLPKLLYWSRDVFFEGGKIQGIVGNSSLLAMVGLVALIVFGLQLAGRTVHRAAGVFWVLVAIATILLTRSATITVALVLLALVLATVLLLRRAGPRGTVAIYATVLALAAAAVILVIRFSSTILGLLGKSDDLTGRLDIWSAVIALAQQRPVAGWGWVSWWVPWVAPFDTLAFEAGVRQLHAHNAWLDIFLQLGVIGLVAFGALILSTTIRSVQFATQTKKLTPTEPGSFTAISLLPLLLLVALLVQSLAESRLLVEYGLFTLVIIAVKTKLGERAVMS
jgi:O-antigen ligase